MLLLGIACGITYAEKLKREFNLELYALLILSVAFGSAVVEGDMRSSLLSRLLYRLTPQRVLYYCSY
jgi:hypothetical protein